MGARRALLLLILLAGCEPEEVEPFEVIYAQPEQGEFAGPATRVELGFSFPIDQALCDEATLHLAALDPATQRIAWFADYTVEPTDGRNRVELVHEGLVTGYDYLLTVQTGPQGCLSAAGMQLQPFGVTFPVVAAGGER